MLYLSCRRARFAEAAEFGFCVLQLKQEKP
jgi:hypothetical protein